MKVLLLSSIPDWCRHNLDQQQQHNSAMQHHHLNLISNSAAPNAPHPSSSTSYHPVGGGAHLHLGRNRVGSAADVDLNTPHMSTSPYSPNSVYVNGYAQHGSSTNLGNHHMSSGWSHKSQILDNNNNNNNNIIK